MSENVSVAESTVQDLYDRNAGRLFAYCYGRLGTRSLAEWAVGATFERASAALSNGGLPEHELDWLLRTADKFCAPRLTLRDGAPADSGALVLDDWEGLTFDQIASRIEASREALEHARGQLSPWRRVLGALNIGSLVSWAKAALTGAGAVKSAAAVVAITGAAVVVGTPVGDRLHDAVRPPSRAKPATPASTGSQVSQLGRAQAGRQAVVSRRGDRGGRPVVAGGKAEAATGRAPRVSPGSPQSPSAPVGPSAAAPAAQAQSGTGGSTASPISAEPAKPTPTVSAAPPAPPVQQPTLPLDTPPPGPSLPQPPPAPSTPSVPDPGLEIPPALPEAPSVDVPAPPATPTVPDAPKLPDPPKLP